MSSLWNKLFLVCALISALGLVQACAHRKAVVAPEPQAGSESEKVASQPAEKGTTTISPEPRISAAETPESAIRAGELPANVEEINKAGYLKDAFFDTDKADLRPDARDLLAADASWLKDHPTVKFLIEGHCDERNTEEYNLALGWRRANAVKAYLASLGVGADRISTISYGEEKPFATCHNESCWVQNRRAHFVVTAR
ncbi:MAG: peptidoglycan-associated lipoprotein Pal [Acidobacteriia bacterium]|nr:peptidoglycan-associated lipoprotein Pal [Terriglobia bacterium]